MRPVLAMFGRELRVSLRHRAQLLQALMYFVLLVVLFPLGSRPEAALLREFAPAILWVAALLASVLSLDRLFAHDARDGTLEQMLLSPAPTTALVLAKLAAHWLVSGLPLVLLSPLLAYALGLTSAGMLAALVTLALGTPVLLLVGAIGAALTLNVGGGMLLALILLPLYTPVLIFGAHSVALAADGLPISGLLYILGAFLVLALTLAPAAIAAALRISLEN